MMIDDDDAVRAGQTGPHHDMRVGLQRPTHMGGRLRVVDVFLFFTSSRASLISTPDMHAPPLFLLGKKLAQTWSDRPVTHLDNLEIEAPQSLMLQPFFSINSVRAASLSSSSF